ncbi:MAG: hypothetical protein ABJD02_19595 [Paraglaciecola sp.]
MTSLSFTFYLTALLGELGVAIKSKASAAAFLNSICANGLSSFDYNSA